ncbi:MAG: alpha-amylase family glycosyl hydrolase [Ilumatobacteraceae bacterium]
MNPTPTERSWWRDAVVYQVYVRSFADSNGDGIGDIAGIRSRLDHLSSLGVDAIWLNPCYPSPQRDHGYDVADYFAIEPDYGTLADFDALVAAAAEHGIRIVMDLVPNHCSNEHAWFVAAVEGEPDGPERARFWVRDGLPDGSGDAHGAPPNNWRAAFGGPAWTRLSPTDPQWYLGTFSPHQPDINHTNADVQAMFVDVIEFWFERGVDGFRVDAIRPVGKHPDLPDQPPVPEGIRAVEITWLNPHIDFRPEGHDVWRYFRRTIDTYTADHPGRDLMMVAEAYLVGRPEVIAEFTRPDEFHQAFSFDLMLAAWSKESIENALADVFWLADRGVPPCWALNNHDIQRIVTRLGRADAHVADSLGGSSLLRSTAPVDEEVGRRRSRATIALAMALPGSIYLYQGEELGLPEVLDVPDDRREDPVFLMTGGAEQGRDGSRVPIPWTAEPSTSYGFSDPPGAGGDPDPPWLPQPDGWGDRSLAEQVGEEDSMVELYRTLIAARSVHAVQQPDTAELVDLGAALIAVRRGDLLAVMNVSGEPVALDLDRGELGGARPVLASEPADMHTPGVIPPDSTIWLVS